MSHIFLFRLFKMYLLTSSWQKLIKLIFGNALFHFIQCVFAELFSILVIRYIVARTYIPLGAEFTNVDEQKTFFMCKKISGNISKPTLCDWIWWRVKSFGILTVFLLSPALGSCAASPRPALSMIYCTYYSYWRSPIRCAFFWKICKIFIILFTNEMYIKQGSDDPRIIPSRIVSG